MKRKFIYSCIPPVLLLVLWQLAASSGYWSTYLLPKPSMVAQSVLELSQNGDMIRHITISLERVLLGFALASIVAIPMAMLIGLWPRAYAVLNPTLEFFRHVPPLAILPLIILWLGIGEGSKLAIVFLATFYPIFLNALMGFQQTNYQFVELAKQYQLSKFAIFWHIRMPQAIPYLYTGLRIGLGYSWRSLIGAEMIAAASGLGYLILDAQAMARSDIVVAGILVIGCSGICLDFLFRLLAKKLFGNYLQGGADYE